MEPLKNPHLGDHLNKSRGFRNFDPLFKENVKDIADTIAEVMVVCGIHRCKAKASRFVVVKAFQFYDIKRHSFTSALNDVSILRDDIVGDFESRCQMNRIEALLAYCIVKRALKAFYYGQPDHSIRSPVTEAVLLKEQDFVWQHAARRTAMLFERYEHMFFNAQRNYASQIVSIYKELHKRLKSRADPVILEDCTPRGCVQRVISGTSSPVKFEKDNRKCEKHCAKSQGLKKSIDSLPYKKFPIITSHSPSDTCPQRSQKPLVTSKVTEDCSPPKRRKEVNNEELHLPQCSKCNCPKLMCDCSINRNTGHVAVDCGEGPLRCQWFCVQKPEKFVKPEFHQCPVDCVTSEESCGSDSSEYCECSNESPKDSESYYSEQGY
ncbi:uncharacterized protein LOC142233918 [Haematobia irritans]|uniref:uncharacterized protein LOC142233918 n=1 Tax=Haematobia irritans TaxID=7368 RepID=UPI003F4F7DFD